MDQFKHNHHDNQTQKCHHPNHKRECVYVLVKCRDDVKLSGHQAIGLDLIRCGVFNIVGIGCTKGLDGEKSVLKCHLSDRQLKRK